MWVFFARNPQNPLTISWKSKKMQPKYKLSNMYSKEKERKARQEVTNALSPTSHLPTVVQPWNGECGLRRTLAPLRQPAPACRHQDSLDGGGCQTSAEPAGAAWAELAWSLPALLRPAGHRGEPLDGPGERHLHSATAALQDSGAGPWQAEPQPGCPLWDGGPGGGALPGAGPVHGGGGGAEGRGHGVQAA